MTSSPITEGVQGASDHATAVDPQDAERILNRLRRAQGQLGGVIRMMEEGRDCGEVLPQLAAVSKALSRAGYAIVATNLAQCLTHPDEAGAGQRDLEKLFLSLA